MVDAAECGTAYYPTHGLEWPHDPYAPYDEELVKAFKEELAKLSRAESQEPAIHALPPFCPRGVYTRTRHIIPDPGRVEYPVGFK